MRLSPHFTSEELTITQVRGVRNEPINAVMENLKETAQRMEAVRTLLGNHPIIISSGYRSALVNSAVGGAKGSAHISGYACDFLCPGFGTPLEICRVIEASSIQFDQLIEEGTWVHLSFAPAMRRNILIKSGTGFIAGLPSATNTTV